MIYSQEDVNILRAYITLRARHEPRPLGVGPKRYLYEQGQALSKEAVVKWSTNYQDAVREPKDSPVVTGTYQGVLTYYWLLTRGHNNEVRAARKKGEL